MSIGIIVLELIKLTDNTRRIILIKKLTESNNLRKVAFPKPSNSFHLYYGCHCLQFVHANHQSTQIAVSFRVDTNTLKLMKI